MMVALEECEETFSVPNDVEWIKVQKNENETRIDKVRRLSLVSEESSNSNDNTLKKTGRGHK